MDLFSLVLPGVESGFSLKAASNSISTFQLAQLEGQSAAARADGASRYVDYHFEASEFEKKLIQVSRHSLIQACGAFRLIKKCRSLHLKSLHFFNSEYVMQPLFLL